MSKIRLRRLKADQARIAQAFEGHQQIRIVKTKGTPPDRYQIEYRIQSLALNGERVVKRDRHVAEIYLTTGYPRQPPQCRMLTPIFHPNVDPNAICVGDHWAAGESLPNLVVRIGEIIAYQSYNTKSPLNGEAARWCDENRKLLPIDEADLRPESLAQAESAKIEVKNDPPPAAPSGIPRGRLVGGSGGSSRPRSSGGPPRGRLVRSGSGGGSTRPPKGRILRAKKVTTAPSSRPQPGPPAASAGGVIECPCGRRYRPRKPRPFRCLACGTRLTPPGA